MRKPSFLLILLLTSVVSSAQSGLHSKWVNEHKVIYFDMSGTIWEHDIQSLHREEVLKGSQPAVHPTLSGIYAYRARTGGKSRITITDKPREQHIFVSSPALNGLNAYHPIWSFDGSMLAFNAESQDNKTSTLFIYDYGSKTLLAHLQGHSVGAPSFFPNGDILITIRDEGGSTLVRYDHQSKKLTELMSSTHKIYFSDASPDGKEIVLTYGQSGNLDIWLLNIGTGETRQLTQTPYDEYGPRWSPSGKRLTYFAEMDNNYPAFVMDLKSKKTVRLTN